MPATLVRNAGNCNLWSVWAIAQRLPPDRRTLRQWGSTPRTRNWRAALTAYDGGLTTPSPKGPPMTNEELIALLAQRVATLNARCDALQSVLVATVAALGTKSNEGGAMIEKMSLFASEKLAALQASRGYPAEMTEETKKHVETILAAVRTFRTGKAQ